MHDMSLYQKFEETLVVALRTLWEQAHGTSVGQVRVLVGPDSVAAQIEGALSPAERTMAQSVDGRLLLQRYAEQLLAVIQPDLRAQVESITGHRVVSAGVRADVDTGHVLCFFVLNESLALLSTPNAESPL